VQSGIGKHRPRKKSQHDYALLDNYFVFKKSRKGRHLIEGIAIGTMVPLGLLSAHERESGGRGARKSFSEALS